MSVMKNIVFIVTDANRNTLHVGMSSDLIKTMEFYAKMPSLFNANKKLSSLVYFEEFNSEITAHQRFQDINKFTRAQKEKLIRDVNNNWLDLTMAIKYERNLQKNIPTIAPIFSYAS